MSKLLNKTSHKVHGNYIDFIQWKLCVHAAINFSNHVSDIIIKINTNLAL